MYVFLLFLESSGFYSEPPDGFLPDDMCATSEWSGWSSCSTTCGKGYESRTRRFYNRMGIKKCPHVDIAERRNCAGSVAVCPQYRGSGMLANPDCAVTTWSDWSPCSVSCGKKNENFTLQTWVGSLIGNTQCGNFRNFQPLRFYV